MAREVPQIDRLIEEGLTLYGQGEFERALVVWERVLVIEPENAQAASYVDYVRQNYELLTQQVQAIDDHGTIESAPFGIGYDEAEYQIEVSPGEVKPADPLTAPLFMDPLDEGWFIDEQTSRALAEAMGAPSNATTDSGGHTFDLEMSSPSTELDRPELTFELEADEPPDHPEQMPDEPRDQSVGFDDATREYGQLSDEPVAPVDPFIGFPPPAPPASTEFGPETTPGFGTPDDYRTPPGFGSQVTGVRPRELGYVQPRVATLPGASVATAPRPGTGTLAAVPDPDGPAVSHARASG
ncbi:MAG: hypothetical protein M3680_32510, partial [Myxococcota bacterium]|nr:hypothetical protein [Myxococcota bacterium]